MWLKGSLNMRLRRKDATCLDEDYKCIFKFAISLESKLCINLFLTDILGDYSISLECLAIGLRIDYV